VATNAQVHCINKQDRPNPHERIINIGGIWTDGLRWKITQQQAISDIEAGKYAFWVSVKGTSVWIVVAVSRFGNKYLKTQNDGEDQNNLLSLQECPA
jgi:hypothetical protein